MPLSHAVIEEHLAHYRRAPRWLVAYSGGVDSAVLLHLLASMAPRPPLLAVHINHRLQSEADAWERQCRDTAAALGVDFQSIAVDVAARSPSGPEQAAREARYAAFETLVQPGDCLLMAHHLDDQVETVLLRLLRGSGSRGLAAIPAERQLGAGRLLRPLLECSRADIEHYARQHNLQWVEDPSNRHDTFDRNYLRQRVLPLIAERWPGYRQTLGRTAALSDEANRLNRELAELDCHALGLSPQAPSLPIAALRELSPGRCRNLLRHWFQSRGLPAPSAVQMDTLIAEVMHASRDARPLLEWPGVQVRRFRDELYAMPPLAPFGESPVVALSPGETATIEGVGAISLQTAAEGGIAGRHLLAGALEVRFRRGGERCQPAGRAGSQTLKKLLQEYAVEPWLRDRVPLVYIDDRLAAVGDYWVCEGFTAEPGTPGYRCHWDRDFFRP